jgi:hypothetical protein
MKTISLWEMIHFVMQDLAPFFYLKNKLIEIEAQRKENPSRPLTPDDRKNFCNDLKSLEPMCLKLELTDLYVRIGTAKYYIETGQDESLSTIGKTLQMILAEIGQHLDLRHFASIPIDRFKYFEQEKLFGELVYKNFKNAQADIRDAGNCLAMDLSTAAIYHLMCVVNVGLLALAKHLKLKIKAIEFQEWKNIIDGLQKRVGNVGNSPKGKKKQADLEFYNGLLMEFAGFKDVYRNNMAHARCRYTFNEAVGVHDRVRDFMKRLATKITE